MQHAEKERRPLLPLDAARANREPLAFDELPVPSFTGHAIGRAVARGAAPVHRLAVLLPRLGAEGQVPGDPGTAGGARALRRRDRAARRDRRATASLRAEGVYGFWPAHAEGDDIVLANGERFPMLRQQSDWGDSRPNRSLADYVAPGGDHIGAFAVAIHGADELAARYEAEHDDYRVDHGQGARRPARRGVRRVAAPAGAARVVRARRGADQRGAASPRASAASGRRSAIPPAPTTPRSARLFDLLDAGSAGIELTESFAMTPAAAVSGLYFAHPDSKYFAVGRLGTRPGRGLRRPQAGSPWRRPSAGCGRTSHMTRKRDSHRSQRGLGFRP